MLLPILHFQFCESYAIKTRAIRQKTSVKRTSVDSILSSKVADFVLFYDLPSLFFVDDNSIHFLSKKDFFSTKKNPVYHGAS